MGGPVYVPKVYHGKDKTFFFNWESGYAAQGAVVAPKLVPLPPSARAISPKEAEVFGSSNDPNYDVAGKMGLPLVSRLPLEYGPPSISINGPDGAFSVYDLQRQIGPRVRSNSIWQFTDALSWQRGKHFLKIGTEIDRRNVTFGQARAPRGAFGFTGIYTGSALADFMLGYVFTANISPGIISDYRAPS